MTLFVLSSLAHVLFTPPDMGVTGPGSGVRVSPAPAASTLSSPRAPVVTSSGRGRVCDNAVRERMCRVLCEEGVRSLLEIRKT